MAFIEVELGDIQRVQGVLRQARQFILKAAAVRDITRMAADAIRDEAPLGRTGELKRSIYSEVTRVTLDGFESYVKTGSPYVGWVIEGRGVVRPVRAKCLHWISKSGEDVFAMRAGPTEPNPFHERGWKRAEPLIRERWTEYAWSIGARLAD